MITGKDKEKVAELVAINKQLTEHHEDFLQRVQKESLEAKLYLEQTGKSQRRKIDTMILFFESFLKLCDASKKVVIGGKPKDGD